MLVSGLVLAGGLGRRMGGCDKGLQLLNGRPMVQSVIERLRPQVDTILLNVNQNFAAYATFGYDLVPDRLPDFAGPLAGLHAGLWAASTPLVMSVPCDSPFLPLDLVSRLSVALLKGGAQLAVAKTFMQTHPVFCLCRRDLLPHLTDFLSSGGRKFELWYQTLKVFEVAFDDQEAAFSNINTLNDLQHHAA